MRVVDNNLRQTTEDIGGPVSEEASGGTRKGKQADKRKARTARKTRKGAATGSEPADRARKTSSQLKIRDNDADQAIQDIRSLDAIRDAWPDRTSSYGLRIRQNVSGQKKEKIKRKSIKVMPADEIGYKKLFTKFEEAFTLQDLKMIGECLSPAVQWHLPNGKVIYGRKEVLREMEHRFAMPNGPRFSASVWKFLGMIVHQTYEVEYAGPDGKWRKSKGFDVYEIGDGLIVRKDAYWKMIP